MRRYSKFLTAILILALFMTFVLTGCGKKEEVPVTEPTVTLTSDGQLIAYLVEDFDKEYYDLAELEAMVRSEVDEYNAANQSLAEKEGQLPITVNSVGMAEDGSQKAVVALQCANSSVYGDYFDTKVFYGTVAQALEDGYELSAALVSVKDGELFTKELAEKNSRKNILIIEDSVIVRCPKKVLYIGTNASLTEEGFVDGTQNEGLKLIIMK